MKAGWVGRCGRFPSTIVDIAAQGGSLLNGTAPVNIFVEVKGNQSGVSPSRVSTTDLDRDHPKRKDVPFLAIRPPLVQDFWRNPSSAVAMLVRGSPYRILESSDRCKTEICDPCATCGIHKDIWLDGDQYSEARFGAITYSLEISMNHIKGVEVVEAFGDTGQLVRG